LIVCRYHPDEPKWAFVRYMYGIISKDLKMPYYENITFSYILPEKIPSIRAFSPERMQKCHKITTFICKIPLT